MTEAGCGDHKLLLFFLFFVFFTNCITFGAFRNTTLLLSYCAISLHSKPPIFLVSLKGKKGEKAPEMPVVSSPRGFWTENHLGAKGNPCGKALLPSLTNSRFNSSL